jgi:hypothetical protein
MRAGEWRFLKIRALKLHAIERRALKICAIE